MSAHTPGPWSPILNFATGNWRVGVIRQHAAQALTSKEDATLAAAAPDLLSLAVRADEALSNGCGPVKDSNNPLEALRFDLQAIIAKAEGRS